VYYEVENRTFLGPSSRPGFYEYGPSFSNESPRPISYLLNLKHCYCRKAMSHGITPVYGMIEHIVGVHILKVYTSITLFLTWRLQSWHKGNYMASAHHHSLWRTAQRESHPVRGAQAVGASLHHFPLNWRRNTQIQMYWLWEWLESYNNCTFSTWKDKFVFSLLLWIPNSFCAFHDYGRGGTPFLALPDGT